MKTLRRLLLLVLAVFCLLPVAQAQPKKKAAKHKTASCTQGKPFRGCPACGTAKDNTHRRLNLQKNRDTAATHTHKITVQDIRNPANDTGKFQQTDQVWVTGYVASVEPGGMPETCNCKRTDLRDVHINIVANPSEANDPSKYVVVEFTPRCEQRFGFNDSNYEAMRQTVENKIKGKWVKFSGWMMYDFIHKNASQSTSPGNRVCPPGDTSQSGCNWRATPWEVHPVTD